MVLIAGDGAREVPMVPTQCHGCSARGRSAAATEHDADRRMRSGRGARQWCAPVVRVIGADGAHAVPVTACMQVPPRERDTRGMGALRRTHAVSPVDFRRKSTSFLRARLLQIFNVICIPVYRCIKP